MIAYRRYTAIFFTLFMLLSTLLMCGCREKKEEDTVSDTSDASETVYPDNDGTEETTEAASSSVLASVPEPQPNVTDAPPAVDTEAPVPVTDYVPVDPVASSVFDNSLFIGDSRTLGLGEYADLGKADVFAASGLNVIRVFSEKINVNGRGITDLGTLLANKKYDRIYVMLGLNEIGYDHGFILKKYGDMIGELRSRSGDAKIVVCANLHITQKRSANDSVYNNRALNELNSGMKNIADGVSIRYIDVNPLFDDANGALSEAYTVDDFHLKGKYYSQWGQWLAAQPI